MWMHWYWITVFFLHSVMGDQRGTLSPNKENLSKLTSYKASFSSDRKSIKSSQPSPTTLLNSSLGQEQNVEKHLQNVLLKKASLLEFSNNSEEQISVINENITNKFLNMSDNQVNANFLTDFNATDINMTCIENVTKSEQSGLLNSEQINVDKNGSTEKMSALEIIGICVCCVLLFAIVSSIGYFFYNNRGFNRPEVLNDHCSNPDSSGYLDDTSVRDNSEEMYSLDNDSFLNSLEAMTIQNYWTDTVKHTKL